MLTTNRMSKICVLIIVILLSGQLVFGAWIKQGVYEGNSTCVHVATDGRAFVGTAGAGLFTSLDGIIWTEANFGIDNPYLVAITSNSLYPEQVYCATKADIYYSLDHGSSWSKLPPIPALQPITCLAVAVNCGGAGNTFLYAGTYGQGLWRYNNSLWTQSMNGLPYRILSLAAFDNTLMAGTETDNLIYVGGLYSCYDCDTDAWVVEADTANISFLSLSSRLNPQTGDTPIRLAGTDGSGIYSSTGGANSFVSYSDNTPFGEPFRTVDFAAGMSGDFEGLSGTNRGLWCLIADPRVGSTSGYSPIDGFSGNVAALSLLDTTTSLVGTSGKGVFMGNPTTQTVCDVPTNVSHGQIEHKQVNRIALSSNFLADDTVFLASRSEGIYKSKGFDDNGSREFTRFFCDPEGFAPLDVLSLTVVPTYNELGIAGTGTYTSDKVILVGSNGRGIFLTDNGGASWARMNNGDMPDNAVVVDVAYAPAAPVDQRAFALVKDRGLFLSTNMGQMWLYLDPALINCGPAMMLRANRMVLSPLFTQDQTIWIGSDAGLLRVYYNSTDEIWECDAMYTGDKVTTLVMTTDGFQVYVYFGTQSNGVFRGEFNGTWDQVQLADSGITATDTLIDLAVSPDWYSDGTDQYVVVYALKKQAGGDLIYYANDYPDLPPAAPIWTSQPRPLAIYLQSLALAPDFDPTDVYPERDLVFVGSTSLGLNYGIHSQLIAPADWDDGVGYYAFPHEVTATTSDPFDPEIVFFATRDLGVFVSYDGGQSACPWGRELEDINSRTVYDISTINITHDPTARTVLIGTNGSGIYSSNYSTRADIMAADWAWSTSVNDSDAIRYSFISKIVFYSNTEALWASVSDGISPAYYHDPTKASFPLNWEPVLGGLPGAHFSSITYGEPLLKSAIAPGSEIAALLKGPRAIIQSMWGCSGGQKSPYKSSISRDTRQGATPGAYHYDGSFWILTNGTAPYNLSEEIYYNAIYGDSNDNLFIGGWSDDTNYQTYSGIWRSSDEGLTWVPANVGLTTLNMKTIGCFLETSTGKMLVGVKDNDDGGVFMSDNGGYAWARIDDFEIGERGVNELSEDENTPPKYWASMVNGGSQQETELTFTEGPVPEFLINNQDRTLIDSLYAGIYDYTWWASAAKDSTVTFSSKSAGASQSGMITYYEWDLDGDLVYDEEGVMATEATRVYSSVGIKTITLRLNSDDNLVRTHRLFIYDSSSLPPAMPDGDTFGNAVTVTKKTADANEITVSWDYASMTSHNCLPQSVNIIHGPLSSISTYADLDSVCSINGEYDWDTGSSSNFWFVLVSSDNAGTESSWGNSVISGVTQPRNTTVASGQCGCSSRNNNGACGP